MLGYKTIRKRHRSTSQGSGSSQSSTHYTEERRALMLPQEIKELPKDEELIFYEGCKPIRANKNWYFKDKMLMKRASMPPAVIKPVAKRTAKGEPVKEIMRPQNEQVSKRLQ
jgi:type IV secretion system protein VirD4